LDILKEFGYSPEDLATEYQIEVIYTKWRWLVKTIRREWKSCNEIEWLQYKGCKRWKFKNSSDWHIQNTKIKDGK